jgi:hypothetical protein
MADRFPILDALTTPGKPFLSGSSPGTIRIDRFEREPGDGYANAGEAYGIAH